jgi:DNA repair protein RadA
MPLKKYKTLGQFKSVPIQVLQKVKELGYNLEVISGKDPVTLSQELGITQAKSKKLIKQAKDNLVFYFETANQALERRKNILRLTSGCKAIDNLVEGGFQTQSIIEFYGEFGSGKTQFVHQLSVLAQKPVSQGGLNGSVLVIDTENTYRPERVKVISERFNMDPNQILDNIIISRPLNSDQQITIMEKINQTTDITKVFGRKLEKTLRLIIIDSLVSKFRHEYIGRGTLSERQQKLNKHLGHCLNFAVKNNAIVAVTNQVVANPDFLYSGQIIKPVGGNIVGHSATYRFYLRKAKDSKRVIKTIDAPDLPISEAGYELYKGGIKDIDI